MKFYRNEKWKENKLAVITTLLADRLSGIKAEIYVHIELNRYSYGSLCVYSRANERVAQNYINARRN